MTARVTHDLIPPSVADHRGVAFGKTMARAMSEVDFTRLLFERIDAVDDAILPFLVREFSIEEFVETGMSSAVIRQLLKNAYDLHASKGFIEGVRRGLLMLGMRVMWRQWFETVPPGQPGTHTATVFVNQHIFSVQSALIDARVERAALRMINGMKRWSQDVSFQLAVAAQSGAGIASVAAAGAVAILSGEASALTEFAAGSGVAAASTAALVARGRMDVGALTAPAATAGGAAVICAGQMISLRMEAQAS